MLSVKVENAAVIRALDEAQKRLTDTAPMMNAIAGVMLGEVMENFEQQGRPKWRDLYPGTKAARAKRGTWPGDILQDSGQLLDSISSSSDATSAVVGTNQPYARIQNSGGTIVQPARSNLYTQERYKKGAKKGKFKKGTKAGKGSTSGQRVIDIPARPFMTLPDSGIKKVLYTAERYLSGRNV